ncbi:type II toxin-antitoxin system RelE/ParE family toxin [Lactococcus insecticola]|uniref:type II toxin-antitoxin system RelE/ParE family toxin n=1 Tax=Pseudolactococcus insecticola TaxID=2709158 RepID=UPI001555B346|nr:type II toxin-antitoxin system mRNA interferase toxin, RelE/StbE family [Lactococcus insecticola]
MEYRIEYDPSVLDKISDIRDYISNVLLNPTTADKRVKNIFDDIEKIKYMPEGYPSADEKIGKRLSQKFDTRFTLIVSKKYMVFFFIDNQRIVVSHLLPTSTNYFDLFI